MYVPWRTSSEAWGIPARRVPCDSAGELRRSCERARLRDGGTHEGTESRPIAVAPRGHRHCRRSNKRLDSKTTAVTKTAGELLGCAKRRVDGTAAQP